MLLIPMILLAWVPDLKKLAKVALVASSLMVVALVGTIYKLVEGEPAKDYYYFPVEVMDYPSFISKCVFSIQAICECRIIS